MVLKGYYETNFQPDVLSHGSGRGIAASELSLCSSSAPGMHTQDTLCWHGTRQAGARAGVRWGALLHAAPSPGWETRTWAESRQQPARCTRSSVLTVSSIVSIFWWFFPDVRDKMELRQDGCLRQARWWFGAVWFCSGSRWAATGRRQLASPSEKKKKRGGV